jgi:hypothetical protein
MAHPHNTQTRIPCEILGCNIHFARPADMRRHVKEVHSDPKLCPEPNCNVWIIGFLRFFVSILLDTSLSSQPPPTLLKWAFLQFTLKELCNRKLLTARSSKWRGAKRGERLEDHKIKAHPEIYTGNGFHYITP